MAPNIPELRYVACWTEDDGLYYCGCEHKTIQAAMGCIRPDGRTFMRAWDRGVLRSLHDDERSTFLYELRRIPQGGVKEKELLPLAASG